ncbi:MAG TPA: hypothetical protein VL400_00615, partial [Polyangiaceae bacterium]|nr:hypothetical protein [Polyangiaceae bacterium]
MLGPTKFLAHALTLALGAVALSSCGASVADVPPPPMVMPRLAAVPRSDLAPKLAPTTGSGRVKVLYQDDWFGGVTLLGIDAASGRAVVRLESRAPARLAFDVIDLATGKRVDRWEASGDHAKKALEGPWFAPLTGSFESDAKRFAGVLRGLGPWHVRPSIPLPTFAVSAREDAWVFGAPSTDGTNSDWLFSSVHGGA